MTEPGQHPVVSAVMSDPVVQAAIVTTGAELPGAAEARVDARAASTAQEAETTLRSQGQRDINRVWEDTQMRLALLTVGGFMMAHTLVVVALALVLILSWSKLAQLPAALAALVAILTGCLGAIASLASLVIGFYFSRTNHTRTGGVGGGDLAVTR